MQRISLSPASRRYLDSRCAAKRAYNAVRHTYKPEPTNEDVRHEEACQAEQAKALQVRHD